MFWFINKKTKQVHLNNKKTIIIPGVSDAVASACGEI